MMTKCQKLKENYDPFNIQFCQDHYCLIRLTNIVAYRIGGMVLFWARTQRAAIRVTFRVTKMNILQISLINFSVQYN